MKRSIIAILIAAFIALAAVSAFAAKTNAKAKPAKKALTCPSGMTMPKGGQCPGMGEASSASKAGSCDSCPVMDKPQGKAKGKAMGGACPLTSTKKGAAMAGKKGGMCPVMGAKSKKPVSAVCPVMKNKIPDVSKAAGKSVYKGKTYYFCCPGCKPMFDKNPEKYLKKTAKR